MRLYSTGEYGIAENGGIIIGVPMERRGADRSQPDKLIGHMLKEKIPFAIDPKQRNRMTEYVLLKDSITETALKKGNSRVKGRRRISRQQKHVPHIPKKHQQGDRHRVSCEQRRTGPESGHSRGHRNRRQRTGHPHVQICRQGVFCREPDTAACKRAGQIPTPSKNGAGSPLCSVRSVYGSISILNFKRPGMCLDRHAQEPSCRAAVCHRHRSIPALRHRFMIRESQ